LLRHPILLSPLSSLSFITLISPPFVFVCNVPYNPFTLQVWLAHPRTVGVWCQVFDIDACPAIANALMLSAFTLCYVPFAPLSRCTPHHSLMLYYVHFPWLLLHAFVSLRMSHASSYYAINDHYELELEATLREMWLQKLSKRVLSRPRTQLNPSCPWESVI